MNADMYCGYCADGHLHWFTNDGANLLNNNATNRDAFLEQFTTNMFETEPFEESTIEDFGDWFISLQPTHCPRKLFNFAPKNINIEQLPNIPVTVAPFRSPQDDSPNPAVYLQNFERTPYTPDCIRFSAETEEICKQRFYALIQDQMDDIGQQQLEHLSYSALTQRFLRRFWSINVQNTRYDTVMAEGIRVNETPRQCLVRWAQNFAFSTVRLSRETIREIRERGEGEDILNPDQLQFIDGYAGGVNSWLDFSDDVRQDIAFISPWYNIAYTFGSIVLTTGVIVSAYYLIRNANR